MKTKHTPLVVLILLVLIIGSSFLFPKTSQAPVSEVKVASPSPTPHTDFREIVKGDTTKKQVIITINAGFGERSAEGILAAYEKRKMKGTFFLVGEWVEDHPELTRRIRDAGHEIFNHSYDHRDYTTLTKEEIKADLQKMDDVLFEIAGVRTRPYYRAPSGARNDAVNAAAAEAGFQHIYWSVDSIDWREGETTETIKNRVLTHLHPGAIVLLHIADAPTGDVIEEIFTEIENKGYKIVSLTEGL